MFTRSNIASKYKNYSKSLQKLKDKFIKSEECLNNRNNVEIFKEVQYYAETNRWNNLKVKKNDVLSSKYVKNCGKILSSIQIKYKTEIELNKCKKSINLQNIISKCTKIKLKSLKYQVAGVSVAASNPNITVEPIPEPPPVPPPSSIADSTAEILNQVNELGEATFASLGLGGWTPVGLAQNAFEFLHVTLGIPWWEAIVLGTIIIRTILFPLVVISQRNAAKMNNYLPQLQAIQLKMTEARQMGNQLEVARYSQEMMIFMKDKNLNPLKNMLVPLAQAPIFISFFMGLRQMANVPVESLRDGGLWWFTDLTVPDQYFLMPLITSITLYATIELGTDSARLSSQNLQTMKYVLRALPLVIFPFTMNFPGAILCYWVSTNFISLAQVGILKIPAVRDYFNIEALVTHKKENLPIKPKGFTEGLKESWTNMKIGKELEERRKLDELQFQRAGRGPVVKTYKHDPTKVVQAKKRD